FRGYNIDDIRFGRHSATLFRPGQTMGNVVDALRGTTGAPQPAATTYATICVRNASSLVLNYSISCGGTQEQRQLDPGVARIYWAPGDQDFTVSCDTTLSDGLVERSFRVPTKLFRGEASKCDDSFTYDLIVDGDWVGLSPASWTPGAEHPFLRGTLEGTGPGN